MSARADLVPVTDRLAGMLRARLLIAVVVAVAALLGDDVAYGPAADLVRASGLYVLVTGGLEVLRRLSGRRGLTLMSAALVVDGAYLAVVIAGTGGSDSPLLFLVHLHVVACTLLMSFRSGTIASLWHGTLLLAVHHVDPAGVSSSVGEVLLAAASFVLVAGATASFASLNERELRRSRHAATALVSLGSSLEASRTVDDVAAAGADHLRDRLGHPRAAVLLRTDEGWAGACDAGEGPVQVMADAPADAAGALQREAGPALVVDLDQRSVPLLASVLPDARHVVVLPLRADGEELGVAVVECGPDRARLAAAELELLEQSAHRIALSVRTMRLLHEVERLAASDPLTGLPNRRLFDATLDREIARARRSGSPLAVGLIDVDHFKAVNDEHGHQVGDQVLCELAAALRGALREEDVVARYGGEEFVVLLPDAAADAAVMVAERLRAAVATGVSRLPITISVGVAALDPGSGGAGVVARADAALYEAKRSGRDRVVLWRPRRLVSSSPAPRAGA